MSTSGSVKLQPSEEYLKSIIYNQRICLVFLIFTAISWIYIGLSILTLTLTLISIIFLLVIFSKLSDQYKSISILSKSIETTSKSNHEIVSFEDIIGITLQFEEYTPSFYVFHPITLILSIMRSIRGKNAMSIVFMYEIETENYLLFDAIESPDYQDVNEIIDALHRSSGITPLIKDYQTIHGSGSIYFFSFRDRHSELNADELSSLK